MGSVMANHALANMLYNDKVWGPKYRQRVRSLVGPGKAFDSAKMLAKIDHLHFLLKPYINIPGIVQSSREDQPRQSPEQFEIAVAGLKGWVKQRPSDVLAVVDTAEWAWPTASSYGFCSAMVFPGAIPAELFEKSPNMTGTEQCLQCLSCKAKNLQDGERCGYQVTEGQCVGEKDDAKKSLCMWESTSSDPTTPEYTCGTDTGITPGGWGVKVYPNKCFAKCVGAVTCAQGSSEANGAKLYEAIVKNQDYDKCTQSLFKKNGPCALR